MDKPKFVLATWQRLSGWPGGKWLFSRMVCWKAPYFATIRPRFRALRPGHCVVAMKKRRAVTNHIATVHAIAMCNLAEIVAGTMTEATVPAGYRWIPKGMTVRYLDKAGTDLVAEGAIEPIPHYEGSFELPVPVSVTNTDGREVFHAVVTMWLSPKSRNAK